MIAKIRATILRWLGITPPRPEPKPAEGPNGRMNISAFSLNRAKRQTAKIQQFEPYLPPDGVIPAEKRAEALALDATNYSYVNDMFVNNFWPGYQYLAMLAQLPEYRKVSEIRAKEMTRNWIAFASKSGGDKAERIADLKDALDKFYVREHVLKALEIEGQFGRAQIFVDVKAPGAQASAREDEKELASILLIDPAKIERGALIAFRVIEPIWTYPSAYNSISPLAPDYYKPLLWFVMGKTVHNSRLLLFVSRPVPDLLKAAYNFGGLSMSQMCQPYVQNWLRTRDSISDLVHSFSLSGIQTNLSALLAGTDDASFENRADIFNTVRDNRGLMLLDKDQEEFFQYNTPLGTLDALQAQAGEQMCLPASIPIVKFWGNTPSGLNANSEGEIQVFYDSISAEQEQLIRPNLQKMINIIQLSEFGEIDEDIVFTFEPLYGMTDVEKATVRKTDLDADAVAVSVGAISPDEVRARLAADPESGYSGLTEDAEEGDPELAGRKMDLTVKSKINDE